MEVYKKYSEYSLSKMMLYSLNYSHERVSYEQTKIQIYNNSFVVVTLKIYDIGLCPVVPYSSMYFVCSIFNVNVSGDFFLFIYVMPGIAVEKELLVLVAMIGIDGGTGGGGGGVAAAALIIGAATTGVGGGGAVTETCVGDGAGTTGAVAMGAAAGRT